LRNSWMSGAGKTRSRAEALAAELLGVNDFRALCESVLARSMLPGQRFEADEFGRDEHSSASAGVILNGVASLPCIEPSVRDAVVDGVWSLVRNDGTLRGHDRQTNVGTTSWSLAQVLLGLSRFGSPRIRSSKPFHAAVTRLRECQDDADGGWLLRRHDLKDVLFAFYPALLFVHLCRDDHWRNTASNCPEQRPTTMAPRHMDRRALPVHPSVGLGDSSVQRVGRRSTRPRVRH
jgi:hypothetical protein